MGIADAIAITMMMTAKNFAMMLRLRPAIPRLQRLVKAAATTSLAAVLGLMRHAMVAQ
jgi:hypothetical protein